MKQLISAFLIILTPFLSHAKEKLSVEDLKAGRWIITEMHLQQASPEDSLFFGDSLVQGMTMSGITHHPVNMGVGGSYLKDIIYRMKNVDINNYASVIVEGGVNDVIAGYDLDEIKSDYTNLFEEASKANKFYFSQMLPLGNKKHSSKNEEIAQLNDFITDMCYQNKKCTLIKTPAEMWVKDNDAYFVRDSIHLKKQAFISWKKEINEALTR